MGSAPDALSPRPPNRPARAPWPPVRTATEAVPEPRPAPQPRPTGEPRSGPSPAKARPTRVVAPPPTAERHYRQTINRVDLWSVLKVSVCFYICSMAVLMVALIALWVIGDAAGVIHNVENFLGDLLQTKDFTFLDGEILRGALLVAA